MDNQTLLLDFRQALLQLEEALGIPPENNVIKAGCIQYFEFSFELAWKTVKFFAENEGLEDSHSPRSALKTAFAKGWINDEDVWLDMLMSRNKMSHTYNASDALGIFTKLPAYLNAMQQLEILLARHGSGDGGTL
jgi:nucleotidyltransferase substrate binding protein (TIGR01987 family)